MSTLDPNASTVLCVRAVLLELLDTLKKHEESLLQKHSEKVLHNYRIAIRRSRSLLGQCHEVIPANRLSRFRRDFSWLAGYTSGPRDMDVFLLRLESMKSGRQADPAAIEPLEKYLQARKDREHRRLYEGMKTVRYERLKRDWAFYLSSPLPKYSRLAYVAKPVKEFADNQIWSCYRRVRKYGRRIDKQSSDDAVHDLRKACKRLRYMIEFFREFSPRKKIARQIKQLKRLQDRLGDFQDLCVQEDILAEFILALDRDIWAPATTRRAMKQLRKQQALEKKAMHKNIPGVFRRYADPDKQQACKKLFQP